MFGPTSPTAGLPIQKQPKLESSSNFDRNPKALIHTSNILDSDSISNIQLVGDAHFTLSPSSNVNMVSIANKKSTKSNLNPSNAINDNPILKAHIPYKVHQQSNFSPLLFPPDYVGPFITIFEHNDSSKNLGRLHPIKIGKLFHKLYRHKRNF